MQILIVGCGDVARSYIIALRALGQRDVSIFDPDPNRAAEVGATYGLSSTWGGDELRLAEIAGGYDAIVLTVASPALLPLLRVCAETAPSAQILIGRPPVLSSQALSVHLSAVPQNNAVLALRSRYLPSIAQLRSRLSAESLRSVAFSFSKSGHGFDPGAYSADVLAVWGVSNCLEVIDAVCALAGHPTTLYPTIGGAGDLTRYPTGSIFTGSGLTVRGVPFAYHGDFGSAGSSGIQIHTNLGRYDLMPLEHLAFVPRGSITSETLVNQPCGDIPCGLEPLLRNWLEMSQDQPLPRLRQYEPVLVTSEAIFGYLVPAAAP
jgi:hypothetical protein